MYYYVTCAIDWWEGLHTVEEYCAIIRKRNVIHRIEYEYIQQEILNIQESLNNVIKNTNIEWEGDITAGPYVFLLPDPDGSCFRYGFVWKQYNNGRTFIASPFELHWLNEYKVI